MTYNDLTEVAKELYEKLKRADERYIVIENEREKITEMEIVTIKMLRPSLPRFKIITEKGKVLLLTPSQFLRKKYVIIKDGQEQVVLGE
jgi:hypothetical protein